VAALVRHDGAALRRTEGAEAAAVRLLAAVLAHVALQHVLGVAAVLAQLARKGALARVRALVRGARRAAAEAHRAVRAAKGLDDDAARRHRRDVDVELRGDGGRAVVLHVCAQVHLRARLVVAPALRARKRQAVAVQPLEVALEVPAPRRRVRAVRALVRLLARVRALVLALHVRARRHVVAVAALQRAAQAVAVRAAVAVAAVAVAAVTVKSAANTRHEVHHLAGGSGGSHSRSRRRRLEGEFL
jgi:hypothetical protein